MGTCGSAIGSGRSAIGSGKRVGGEMMRADGGNAVVVALSMAAEACCADIGPGQPGRGRRGGTRVRYCWGCL